MIQPDYMLDIPVLLESGQKCIRSAVVISGQRVFPFIAIENPQIEAWREDRQLPLRTINIGLVSQQIVQDGFWLPAPFTLSLFPSIPKAHTEKVHEN